jgi:hypothetical protein
VLPQRSSRNFDPGQSQLQKRHPNVNDFTDAARLHQHNADV